MIQTKSIKLNRAFLPILMYTVCVVMTEWMNFTFWCIGRELPFGITEVISLLFTVVVFVLLRGKVSVDKPVISVEVVVGVVLIAMLGIVKSMYPDQSFDTFNYHLIAQNPYFENYFTEDWAYGNFQVWGFRLADRLFYYFRYALGYRMGTILNTLLLMVSFVQIYGILDAIEKNQPDNSDRGEVFRLVRKIGCNKCIWALCILMVWDSILMMGTYYVDIVALPFILELCTQLFTTTETELDGWNIGYFALLNGISIGIKLTNVVFVIPLVGLYLLLNYKRMGMIHWVEAVIVGLFPFLVYLLFNTICTGNPVFPYFNWLFQSVYFDTINIKDLRFGGENLFEQILWVVFAVICPQRRLSEIPDMAPVLLFLGLLFTAMVILIAIADKEKRKEILGKEYLILLAVAIVSGVLWGISTGISRYYIIGRILWGILAFWSVEYLFANYRILGKILPCLALPAMIIGIIYSTDKFLNGTNWCWTAVSMSSLKTQASEVFKDNDILQDKKVNADVFISTDQTLMGVIELLDSETYAVNLNYPSTPEMEAINPWQNCLGENKNIYNIHGTRFNDIKTYVDNMNQYGLLITDFEKTEASSGEYILTKVSEMEDVSNTCYTTVETENYQNQLEAGSYIVTFFAGRFYETGDNNIKIQISDETTGDILAEIPMDSSMAKQYKAEISIKEDTEIGVDFFLEDGSSVAADMENAAFLLNVRWENAR